ncbi:MAG: FAD-binding oxidoreductase [Deltaproteobacteria bacterium]|nr:FAD-binding oxidoreductase [Deltaproteobacteria bacterium]
MNVSREQLTQRLAAELGSAAVSSDSASLTAHRIDGITPRLFCEPDSAEQVSAVLRVCREAKAVVAPWGGGTATNLGNLPRALDVIVSTAKLDKVVEHDAANLTATVQSGIRLAALQKALAPQRQLAPFDPPLPERATIGGIVAANLNGPRRGYYGNVRDLVIGMKVALATGEVIKAGGKVVKNVAGYDMCKLFTGALGTLGIITEVTLRMAALPDESAVISACGTLPQAFQFAEAIIGAPLLPAAVSLNSNGVVSNSQEGWQLTILCEGFAETIARQIRDIQTLADSIGLPARCVEPQASAQQWQQLCNFPARPSSVVYRVTVPRTELRSVVATTGNWNPTPAILADVASAVVWIVYPASEAATQLFPKLIDLAKERRGHAVMFAAPAEVKAGFDVWGPPPPSFALMRKLKQQFDPQGILNPGRFLQNL